MAADMVNEVLAAEKAARLQQEQAEDTAKKIIDEAKARAEDIRQIIADQAQSEARLILTQAQESADGIIKQAKSLSHLREKKVISETEKKYDESIKAVLESLV